MSIRFPDLQVLLPRTTELAKVQPVAEQNTQANLHAQSLRAETERSKRNERVSTANEAAETAVRRRRSQDGGSGGRGGRSRSGKDDESETGRHVDIEV